MRKQEHYIQVDIHKLLNYEGIFHFAVPNGGARNLKVAAALKAEGVLAGVSDLVLVLPNRIVFVEIKNGKDGRQSENQKLFEENVKKLGFEYVIWRSLNDCINYINENNLKKVKKY